MNRKEEVMFGARVLKCQRIQGAIEGGESIFLQDMMSDMSGGGEGTRSPTKGRTPKKIKEKAKGEGMRIKATPEIMATPTQELNAGWEMNRLEEGCDVGWGGKSNCVEGDVSGGLAKYDMDDDEDPNSIVAWNVPLAEGSIFFLFITRVQDIPMARPWAEPLKPRTRPSRRKQVRGHKGRGGTWRPRRTFRQPRYKRQWMWRVTSK